MRKINKIITKLIDEVGMDKIAHFCMDNNIIGTLYAEVDENFVEEEEEDEEPTEDSNT